MSPSSRQIASSAFSDRESERSRFILEAPHEGSRRLEPQSLPALPLRDAPARVVRGTAAVFEPGGAPAHGNSSSLGRV